MNQKARRRSPRLEDVPELMHGIQSRLSLREAACTSVLSKSWLHAWSTIPNLRFHIQDKMKLVDMERTLIRYFDNNIPFQRFELDIDIKNQEAASHTEKWIRSVATKTCLKELSLTICPSGASLDLPAEILSGKNLTKIRVSAANSAVRMTTNRHPECVSLRELHLSRVRISEELLHAIFSSCSLLKKIELIVCSKDLKTIKVKNLPCLSHLQIVTSDRGSTAFEINHVQNLRFFGCNVRIMNRVDKRRGPLINSHSISLGSSVTDLTLGGGMIRDNASLDMINKLGLPFLKSLTLDMACWALGSFHFTSTSINRFSMLGCSSKLLDVVHVTAPKLLFFSLTGKIIPSLLFPYSNLEQIEFRMGLHMDDLDAYFFLKMREAFMLSRKCKVIIKTFNYNVPLPLEINIDDLRTRLLLPPAINVQQVLFKTIGDECTWERSQFFDAFFEICHPDHISIWPDSMLKHNNHFCKFMLRAVLERNKNKTATTSYWPSYLKNVQIKQPHNREWETLTDSHTSFLEGPTPEFRLTWC